MPSDASSTPVPAAHAATARQSEPAGGQGGKPGVARLLAEHVIRAGAAPLSQKAKETALRCILDLLGAAAAALDNPGVAAARRAALQLHGAGAAQIWFTGTNGSPCAALLANSAAAAALDLDDGYRRARGHPGAAVVPAVLAMLSTPGVTAQGLLAAVAAGYEAGLRMSMGRHTYAPSGAWSSYAVIAAAGCLQGVDAQTLAQAFGIAGQISPALPALAGIVGSDVKEGIPAGAVAGYSALQLASAGVNGPHALFDDDKLFAPQRILGELDGALLIEGTYFKPFGCCRHIHGALDAFLLLQRQWGFRREEIAAIEVHTYKATFNLANRAVPTDLVDAQYSVPHCLAVCAWLGEAGLLPLSGEQLAHEEINALAARVTVHHDPAIEPFFPARSPSWIRMALNDGRKLVSPLTDPRGDPANPLEWNALKDKFMTATSRTLDARHQQAVIDGVEQLGGGVLAPLRNALTQPAALFS